MTDSDTRAAPASAEGWLRRCVGVAVHRVGTVRAPSAHEMARRGRWLAFSGLAVDVTTLVDRGLLLLRPAGGSGDARGLGPSGPGAGRGRSARSSRGAPPPSALPPATPPSPHSRWLCSSATASTWMCSAATARPRCTADASPPYPPKRRRRPRKGRRATLTEAVRRRQQL